MKLEFDVNSPQNSAGNYSVGNGFNSESSEVKDMLRSGIALAKDGSRAEARQMLLRVTEADSGNETAWLWLASISEYPEELLVFLQNVLNINPENERALEWAKATKTLLSKTFVQRGINAFHENQKDFAKQCFLQAIVHDAENEMAWLWLASASDAVEEKMSHLQKVLNMNPDNETAISSLKAVKNQMLHTFLKKANSAAVAGERESAREMLNEVLFQLPESEDAWILQTYLTEESYAKVACYEKVLTINPDNEAAQAGLSSLKTQIQKSFTKSVFTPQVEETTTSVEESFNNEDDLIASEPEFLSLAEEPENSLEAFSEVDEEALSALKTNNETIETVQQEIVEFASESETQEYDSNDFTEQNFEAAEELITEKEPEMVHEFSAPVEPQENSNNVNLDSNPDHNFPQSTESNYLTENNYSLEEIIPSADLSQTAEPSSSDHSYNPAEEVSESFESYTNDVHEQVPENISEHYFLNEDSTNNAPTQELKSEYLNTFEAHSEYTETAADQVETSFDKPQPFSMPQVEPQDFSSTSMMQDKGFELVADESNENVSEDIHTTNAEFSDQAEFSDHVDSAPETVSEPVAQNEYYTESYAEPTQSYTEPAQTEHFEFSNSLNNSFAEPTEFEPAENSEKSNSEVYELAEVSAPNYYEEDSLKEEFAENPIENISTDQYSSEEAFELSTSTEISLPVQQHEETHIPVQQHEENHFSQFTAVEEEIYTPQTAAVENDEVLNAQTLYSEETVPESVEFDEFVEETPVMHSPETVPQHVIFNCPFCHSENEPSSIVCHSCRAMLSLSDLEMMLAHQEADQDVILQAVERLEIERSLCEFDENGLKNLGIAHLNAKNIRKGYTFLNEASQLNPNDVVLSSKVNFLAIRLSEIEAQENKAQEHPVISKTILVVDDSPTVRKLITGKLEKCGHSVIAAIDGMDALAKINEVIPDLVLLDITMPRLDGYQVCKLIRNNDLTKDIPVVMISGKDGFFDKVRGRMAGSTGYITKPFGPDTLMKTIETYIS